MIPNPFDSGKLEKMTINALKPAVSIDSVFEVSDVDTDKYMVQVNPETYKVNYQINYDRRQGIGTSGSDAKHSNTPPPALEFDFIFDGTGVIPPPAGPLDNIPIVGAVADLLAGGDEYDVMTELQKFAKVVYKYEGTRHSPRKVRLIWGKLLFDGVLTSMNIDFKLFKPDGSPLRAIVHAAFDGVISDMLREAEEQKSSPDLTHIRNIIAGDKLPLLVNDIYKSSQYYIEVARVNKIYQFRNLQDGAKVSFPPLDKSTK